MMLQDMVSGFVTQIFVVRAFNKAFLVLFLYGVTTGEPKFCNTIYA